MNGLTLAAPPAAGMPETASAGGGYLYGGDAGTSEAYGSTVPLTSVPLVVEWPYSGSPCVLYVESSGDDAGRKAGRLGGGGDAAGASVRGFTVPAGTGDGGAAYACASL